MSRVGPQRTVHARGRRGRRVESSRAMPNGSARDYVRYVCGQGDVTRLGAVSDVVLSLPMTPGMTNTHVARRPGDSVRPNIAGSRPTPIWRDPCLRWTHALEIGRASCRERVLV